MSVKREKKHGTSSHGGIFKNYIVYVVAFVAIFSLVCFGVSSALWNSAVGYVHKIEQSHSAEVRDITLGKSMAEFSKSGSYNAGDKIGTVTVENRGLSCPIYFGANRVTMRNGVGLSGNGGFFDSKSATVISGYDETYFAPLTSVEPGDIISIDLNGTTIEYKVTDAKYIDADKNPYSSNGGGLLVLRSITSDFSSHSGEYYYVFAQAVKGGLN